MAGLLSGLGDTLGGLGEGLLGGNNNSDNDRDSQLATSAEDTGNADQKTTSEASPGEIATATATSDGETTATPEPGSSKDQDDDDDDGDDDGDDDDDEQPQRQQPTSASTPETSTAGLPDLPAQTTAIALNPGAAENTDISTPDAPETTTSLEPTTSPESTTTPAASSPTTPSSSPSPSPSSKTSILTTSAPPPTTLVTSTKPSNSIAGPSSPTLEPSSSILDSVATSLNIPETPSSTLDAPTQPSSTLAAGVTQLPQENAAATQSAIADSNGNTITQAQTVDNGNTGMIGNLPVAAVAGIAGGGGGLVLIIMIILILRCVWRKRRNGNDEALARLDSMYEAGKPTTSESTDKLVRWNKGLSEYHKPSDSSYKAYRM